MNYEIYLYIGRYIFKFLARNVAINFTVIRVFNFVIVPKDTFFLVEKMLFNLRGDFL